MAVAVAGRYDILRGVRVIDGGLASELEYLGARIDGPLWSAHVLEDEPEKVLAVHRAYIAAVPSALPHAATRFRAWAMRRWVWRPSAPMPRCCARWCWHARQQRSFPGASVLVAGSLGPYGAALHNGAEYHGNYDCSYDDLVRFHRERIEVFARATGPQAPDLLAFETFPSLEEVRAVGEAMASSAQFQGPQLQAWFSFSCRDETHVSHGEPVADCAALVAVLPQTVAIGVNCVPPKWIPSLIGELRKGSDLPIMVYPNSGEGWDATARYWTGKSEPKEFGSMAAEWFAAGAQIVGGCCRTRPAHIAAVARVAEEIAEG